jgi:hypothetical protein
LEDKTNKIFSKNLKIWNISKQFKHFKELKNSNILKFPIENLKSFENYKAQEKAW